MKRATREWLNDSASVVIGGRSRKAEVDDVLASDAKQRAEIRDLKARLAFIQLEREMDVLHGPQSAALDLTNKNWRKP